MYVHITNEILNKTKADTEIDETVKKLKLLRVAIIEYRTMFENSTKNCLLIYYHSKYEEES